MRRILVAGDFSGRAWRDDVRPLAAPVAVDRDNIDELPRQCGVRIDLEPQVLDFAELDDFHPDRLLRFAQSFPRRKADPAHAPALPQDGGNLLEAILSRDDPAPAAVSVEDAADLSSFIRRATAGQLISKSGPEDHSDASSWLRSVLHAPKFQLLESAWRGLDLLINGLDEDDTQIWLLDIALPELITHAAQVKEHLRNKGGWALVVANYYFSQSPTAAAVLRQLGELANSVQATLLAGADPPEHDAPGDHWMALRQSPNANRIGLLLPRVLLRLPYGSGGLSIDAFDFEEMPVSEHGNYLWGNSVFVAARLLAAGLASGRFPRRLDGMPLHIYHENGESIAKPCAEVPMTERQAEALLDMGYMPVASLKEQDGVIVVRYQSVGDPAAPLAIVT